MSRFITLLSVLWVATLTHAQPTTQPARPNFLVIIADDLCGRDLGFAGNPDVRTPNLDQLRREGLYLKRMYSPAATCTPTRAALMTGLHGVRSGAYPNHSNIRPGTKTLFSELKAAGYRTALQNKSDMRPAAAFPFEHIQGVDDLSAAKNFIGRDAGQPWMYVFASDDPHNPWTRGDASVYKPRQLTVPPYLFDNLVTRQRMAAYYGEITELDAQVGRVLKILADAKQEQNTVVIFVSEQGSSLPFAGKWTLYDTGVRSSTLVRWPAVVKAGSSSDALLQYTDLAPTLVQLAGVDPAKVDTGCPDADGNRGFDGTSFVPLLRGETFTGHEYAFAQHTGLGVYGIDGPVPTRMVTDGRYKLIRNFNPGQYFMFDAWRQSPAVKSWDADAKHNPALAARLKELTDPPAELLFDLQSDPYELKDLAADPAMAETKKRLTDQLAKWMAQQGDQGLDTEKDFKAHMRKADEGRDPD